MNPNKLEDVNIGDKVTIKMDNGEDMTGVINRIITKVNFHHFGIKVELTNKTIGRTIKIHSKTSEEEIIQNLKLEFLKNQKLDESETLEFKSTFISNYHEFITNNTIIRFEKGPKSIAKTIAAFANNNGGTLYIGIDDISKKILGLKNDYYLLEKKNSDGFLKELKNSLNHLLGKVNLTNCIYEKRILHFPNGDICVIKASPSKVPIILYWNEKYELYVRDSDHSIQYESISEFCTYWCEHTQRFS